METKAHIQALFQKYIDGTIDRMELAELTSYTDSKEYESLWQELLESHYQNTEHNPKKIIGTIKLPEDFDGKAELMDYLETKNL